MALGLLAQGPSSPALAHYALVKSLASGTAVIDETREQTGTRSYDVSFFEGHYYANKAPGLAFLTLPAYLAADAAGLRPTGEHLEALWVLSLAGALLPALGLLLLVRFVGERLEPGFGAAAALTLGLGTLVTPFATVFFPHALSATLVFASFTLLFVERRGETRLLLVAAAGLLAGYAFTTEYHNVFAGVVLGIYAVARAGWLRRGAAYGAGVAAGVLPLLLYNHWAFGSATHLTYVGSVLEAGESGHDVQLELRSAVGLPDFSSLVALLLSDRGVLTTAPVLALGIVGLVVLYRRGARADTLAIAGTAAAYLLYTSAFFDPFGAVPPGPRYLVPMVPFLALPLAIAFRRYLVPAVALAAVSITWAVVVTVTRPHIAWDGEVLHRLTHPSWWSPMVTDLLGVTAWYRVLPIVLALLVAVSLGVLAFPRPTVSARATLGAGLALAVWGLVATQGSRLLDGALPAALGALLLVCLVLLGGVAASRTLGRPAP